MIGAGARGHIYETVTPTSPHMAHLAGYPHHPLPYYDGDRKQIMLKQALKCEKQTSAQDRHSRVLQP